MAEFRKRLIVVGDRILVRPETGEERTDSGLYLPQTAVSARQAQGGWVAAVGPGVPIPQPADPDADLFGRDAQPHYLPLQALEGDYVLFLKKAAVDITFDHKPYLIVPNAAVLVLVRQELEG